MDYARLDESGFNDCARVQHKKLARAVLRWPTDEDPKEPHAVAEVTPEELSRHAHEDGFRTPCVVRASNTTPASLGMRLPAGEVTVGRLADLIGLHRPINTIDVATQSEGPVYSMEEWVSYFLSPSPRKPLLNVVSLDLSDTPLQNLVDAPALVKELDLVGKVWPHGDCRVPKVQLYALMSVADCFMDFHVDFGGSSVWYHVLSGRKVFLLVPPSKGNLVMFEEWASSEKQGNVFFAERANGCQKVELLAGDTLFLPGGWPHSVATPVDSIVLGGNFLNGYNLALQLEIWQMEERLKVRPKFRFPLYKTLMWHTAAYYLELLKSSDGGANNLTEWEREGIPCLWRSLQSWLQQSYDSGDVPPQISNPAALLDDLEGSIKKSGLHSGDLIKGGSSKVRVLLKGDASVERGESFHRTHRNSWPLKKTCIGSDEEYQLDEDKGRDRSDEEFGSKRDVKKELKFSSLSTPEQKVKETSSEMPTGGRTMASPTKRRTPVNKKLTKLNSTVRDRLLKKIGLDPRIPLPSPKYGMKKLES